MDRILRLATLPRLAGLIVIAMLLDGCSGSGAQVTGNSPSSSSPAGTTPTPTSASVPPSAPPATSARDAVETPGARRLRWLGLSRVQEEAPMPPGLPLKRDSGQGRDNDSDCSAVNVAP